MAAGFGYLGTLGFDLLHEVLRLARRVDLEGVVGNAGVPVFRGIEDAKDGVAQIEPDDVDAGDHVALANGRSEDILVKAHRLVEVLGVEIPRTKLRQIGHDEPPSNM